MKSLRKPHIATLATTFAATLVATLVATVAALAVSSAIAQTTPRPQPAQRAAPAPAPVAQANTAGSAGVLLDQGQAARLVGGYWRVHWADDAQNFGIMHVTGVNVADNLMVFDGVYSPDGLTTCPISGNWVYVTRGYYSTGGVVQQMELSNFARIRINCPGRETNIEALAAVGPPLVFSGKAVHSQANQLQTITVRIRRFGSSF